MIYLHTKLKNSIQIIEKRIKQQKTKLIERTKQQKIKVKDSGDPFIHGKPFYFDHRIHNEEPTWSVAKTKTHIGH